MLCHGKQAYHSSRATAAALFFNNTVIVNAPDKTQQVSLSHTHKIIDLFRLLAYSEWSTTTHKSAACVIATGGRDGCGPGFLFLPHTHDTHKLPCAENIFSMHTASLRTQNRFPVSQLSTSRSSQNLISTPQHPPRPRRRPTRRPPPRSPSRARRDPHAPRRTRPLPCPRRRTSARTRASST